MALTSASAALAAAVVAAAVLLAMCTTASAQVVPLCTASPPQFASSGLTGFQLLSGERDTECCNTQCDYNPFIPCNVGGTGQNCTAFGVPNSDCVVNGNTIVASGVRTGNSKHGSNFLRTVSCPDSAQCCTNMTITTTINFDALADNPIPDCGGDASCHLGGNGNPCRFHQNLFFVTSNGAYQAMASIGVVANASFFNAGEQPNTHFFDLGPAGGNSDSCSRYLSNGRGIPVPRPTSATLRMTVSNTGAKAELTIDGVTYTITRSVDNITHISGDEAENTRGIMIGAERGVVTVNTVDAKVCADSCQPVVPASEGRCELQVNTTRYGPGTGFVYTPHNRSPNGPQRDLTCCNPSCGVSECDVGQTGGSCADFTSAPGVHCLSADGTTVFSSGSRSASSSHSNTFVAPVHCPVGMECCTNFSITTRWKVDVLSDLPIPDCGGMACGGPPNEQCHFEGTLMVGVTDGQRVAIFTVGVVQDPSLFLMHGETPRSHYFNFVNVSHSCRDYRSDGRGVTVTNPIGAELEVSMSKKGAYAVLLLDGVSHNISVPYSSLPSVNAIPFVGYDIGTAILTYRGVTRLHDAKVYVCADPVSCQEEPEEPRPCDFDLQVNTTHLGAGSGFVYTPHNRHQDGDPQSDLTCCNPSCGGSECDVGFAGGSCADFASAPGAHCLSADGTTVFSSGSRSASSSHSNSYVAPIHCPVGMECCTNISITTRWKVDVYSDLPIPDCGDMDCAGPNVQCRFEETLTVGVADGHRVAIVSIGVVQDSNFFAHGETPRTHYFNFLNVSNDCRSNNSDGRGVPVFNPIGAELEVSMGPQGAYAVLRRGGVSHTISLPYSSLPSVNAIPFVGYDRSTAILTYRGVTRLHDAKVYVCADPAPCPEEPELPSGSCDAEPQFSVNGLTSYNNAFVSDDGNSADSICCNAECGGNPSAPVSCVIGGTMNCSDFDTPTSGTCLTPNGQTIVASGDRPNGVDHGSAFFKAMHCPMDSECCTNVSITATVNFDALEDNPIPDCSGGGSDAECVLGGNGNPCRYHGTIIVGVSDGVRVAVASVGFVQDHAFFTGGETPNSHFFELMNMSDPCERYVSGGRGHAVPRPIGAVLRMSISPAGANASLLVGGSLYTLWQAYESLAMVPDTPLPNNKGVMIRGERGVVTVRGSSGAICADALPCPAPCAGRTVLNTTTFGENFDYLFSDDGYSNDTVCCESLCRNMSPLTCRVGNTGFDCPTAFGGPGEPGPHCLKTDKRTILASGVRPPNVSHHSSFVKPLACLDGAMCCTNVSISSEWVVDVHGDSPIPDCTDCSGPCRYHENLVVGVSDGVRAAVVAIGRVQDPQFFDQGETATEYFMEVIGISASDRCARHGRGMGVPQPLASTLHVSLSQVSGVSLFSLTVGGSSYNLSVPYGSLPLVSTLPLQLPRSLYVMAQRGVVIVQSVRADMCSDSIPCPEEPVLPSGPCDAEPQFSVNGLTSYNNAFISDDGNSADSICCNAECGGNPSAPVSCVIGGTMNCSDFDTPTSGTCLTPNGQTILASGDRPNGVDHGSAFFKAMHCPMDSECCTNVSISATVNFDALEDNPIPDCSGGGSDAECVLGGNGNPCRYHGTIIVGVSDGVRVAVASVGFVQDHAFFTGGETPNSHFFELMNMSDPCERYVSGGRGHAVPRPIGAVLQVSISSAGANASLLVGGSLYTLWQSYESLAMVPDTPLPNNKGVMIRGERGVVTVRESSGAICADALPCQEEPRPCDFDLQVNTTHLGPGSGFVYTPHNRHQDGDPQSDLTCCNPSCGFTECDVGQTGGSCADFASAPGANCLSADGTTVFSSGSRSASSSHSNTFVAPIHCPVGMECCANISITTRWKVDVYSDLPIPDCGDTNCAGPNVQCRFKETLMVGVADGHRVAIVSIGVVQDSNFFAHGETPRSHFFNFVNVGNDCRFNNSDGKGVAVTNPIGAELEVSMGPQGAYAVLRLGGVSHTISRPYSSLPSVNAIPFVGYDRSTAILTYRGVTRLHDAKVYVCAEPASCPEEPELPSGSCDAEPQFSVNGLTSYNNAFVSDDGNSADSICCNAECGGNPSAPVNCVIGGTMNCSDFDTPTSGTCLTPNGQTILASGDRPNGVDHGSAFFKAMHCPMDSECCTNVSITATVNFDALEDNPIPDCSGGGSDAECVLGGNGNPCRYHGTIIVGVSDGVRVAVASVGFVQDHAFFTGGETPNSHFFELMNMSDPCERYVSGGRGHAVPRPIGAVLQVSISSAGANASLLVGGSLYTLWQAYESLAMVPDTPLPNNKGVMIRGERGVVTVRGSEGAICADAAPCPELPSGSCDAEPQFSVNGLTSYSNAFISDEGNSADSICCNAECGGNPSAPVSCVIGGTMNCSDFDTPTSGTCLTPNGQTIIASGVRPNGVDHGSAFFKAMHCPTDSECCTNVSITATVNFDALEDNPIPDCSGGGSDAECVLGGNGNPCRYHGTIIVGVSDGVRVAVASVGFVQDHAFFTGGETPNSHFFELMNMSDPCERYVSGGRGHAVPRPIGAVLQVSISSAGANASLLVGGSLYTLWQAYESLAMVPDTPLPNNKGVMIRGERGVVTVRGSEGAICADAAPCPELPIGSCDAEPQFSVNGLTSYSNAFISDEGNSADSICCNAECGGNPSAPVSCVIGGTMNCSNFDTPNSGTCLTPNGQTIIASGDRPNGVDHGSAFFKAMHCPTDSECCTNVSISATVNFDALEDSPIPDCGGGGSDAECGLGGNGNPCRYHGTIIVGVSDGVRVAVASVGFVQDHAFFTGGEPPNSHFFELMNMSDPCERYVSGGRGHAVPRPIGAVLQVSISSAGANASLLVGGSLYTLWQAYESLAMVPDTPLPNNKGVMIRGERGVVTVRGSEGAICADAAPCPELPSGSCDAEPQFSVNGLTSYSNAFISDEGNSADSICCNAECGGNPSAPVSCVIGGTMNCSDFDTPTSGTCLTPNGQTIIASGVRPNGVDHGSAFFKAMHCPTDSECCTNVSITATVNFDALEDNPIPDCSGGGSDAECVLGGNGNPCRYHGTIIVGVSDGVRVAVASVGFVQDHAFFTGGETPNSHFFELMNMSDPCERYVSGGRGHAVPRPIGAVLQVSISSAGANASLLVGGSLYTLWQAYESLAMVPDTPLPNNKGVMIRGERGVVTVRGSEGAICADAAPCPELPIGSCDAEPQFSVNGLTSYSNAFISDEGNSADSICCNAECGGNPSAPVSCVIGGTMNCSNFDTPNSGTCLTPNGQTIIASGDRPNGVDHGSAFFKAMHCPTDSECCTNVSITATVNFDALEDNPIPDCSGGGSDAECVLGGNGNPCRYHGTIIVGVSDGVRVAVASVGFVQDHAFFTGGEPPNSHFFELMNMSDPCERYVSGGRGHAVPRPIGAVLQVSISSAGANASLLVGGSLYTLWQAYESLAMVPDTPLPNNKGVMIRGERGVVTVRESSGAICADAAPCPDVPCAEACDWSLLSDAAGARRRRALQAALADRYRRDAP